MKANIKELYIFYMFNETCRRTAKYLIFFFFIWIYWYPIFLLVTPQLWD